MGYVRDDLLGLSDFTFGRTRARLEGLTDDELTWEPVAWCWSVRPALGRLRVDGSAYPASAPAFTTIGWRLDHLVWCYGARRNAEWVGLPPHDDPPTVTASATSELERLDRAHATWRSVLERVDDEMLGEKIGPIGGQYADSTRAALLLHQLDEVIHHGAELGVLRDLYRSQTIEPPPMDTVVDAAANGRWDRVIDLVESGADVNGGATSALHLAVAAHAADVVRFLLDHGADVDAHDAEYDMTPLGWAQYFRNDELVALLS